MPSAKRRRARETENIRYAKAEIAQAEDSLVYDEGYGALPAPSVYQHFVDLAMGDLPLDPEIGFGSYKNKNAAS